MSSVTSEVIICKACNSEASGRYCSNCGQSLSVKRITLGGLFHDAFHLFTHLDKGFLLTVKTLLKRPGHMQREYIEGDRARHQKPFAMFFVAITVCALIRYWLYLFILNHFQSGDAEEVDFIHQGMTMLHVALLPFYVLVAYLFFAKSKYNYAEIGIVVLYSMSVFFMAAWFTGFTKLIWHEFDTAYVELPLLLIYHNITWVNFFRGEKKWLVILKATAILIMMFAFIQYAEDILISMRVPH